MNPFACVWPWSLGLKWRSLPVSFRHSISFFGGTQLGVDVGVCYCRIQWMIMRWYGEYLYIIESSCHDLSMDGAWDGGKYCLLQKNRPNFSVFPCIYDTFFTQKSSRFFKNTCTTNLTDSKPTVTMSFHPFLPEWVSVPYFPTEFLVFLLGGQTKNPSWIQPGEFFAHQKSTNMKKTNV